MDFAEFQRHAEALFREIEKQQPLAILRYGSSLVEDDFLPGVSDLDAFILSEHPIATPDNAIGFVCEAITPREFVRRLTLGDTFILHAAKQGHVAYDPHGFLRGLRSLADAGGLLRPTDLTFSINLVALGNQLSTAWNRCLSDDSAVRSPQRILRAIEKVYRAMGVAEIARATGQHFSSYASIVENLAAIGSPLLDRLERIHRDVRDPAAYPSVKWSPTEVRQDDPIGVILLEAELAYVERGDWLGGYPRRETRRLLHDEVARRGPLDRVHAVRVNNTKKQHQVLAQRGTEWRLFGFRAEGDATHEVDLVVPAERVDAVLADVHLIRG